MDESNLPIPGLNLSFWGIVALIFGGITLAGLGQAYAGPAFCLLGGGGAMLLVGLGRRLGDTTRYGRGIRNEAAGR